MGRGRHITPAQQLFDMVYHVLRVPDLDFSEHSLKCVVRNILIMSSYLQEQFFYLRNQYFISKPANFN